MLCTVTDQIAQVWRRLLMGMGFKPRADQIYQHVASDSPPL